MPERLTRVAALSGAVLIAATAAARSAALVPAAPAIVVASSVFFGLVGAIGLFTDHDMVGRGDWRSVQALVVSAAILILLAAFGALSTGAGFFLLLAITYAAWVEESVFRIIVPRAFAQQVGRGPAAVASQALFAATHFVPGTWRSAWPDPALALRFFAGGLLLWVIVSRAGLTAGVLAHALFNATVLAPLPASA